MLVVVLVVALTTGAAACKATATNATDDFDPIGPAYFQRGLVEREKITPEQAKCVSDQVFAAYDNLTVRRINNHGIVSLPSTRWAPYTYAVLECVVGPELEGGAPPPGPRGTAP